MTRLTSRLYSCHATRVDRSGVLQAEGARGSGALLSAKTAMAVHPPHLRPVPPR